MATHPNQFYEQLLAAFRDGGGQPAVVHYDERYSYDDLYAAMRRINGRLSSRRNESIAVYAEKSLPAYAAIFSSILSGNTWVPVNPVLPWARVQSMLELADAKIVLTDQPPAGAFQAFADANGIEIIDLAVAESGADADFDLGGIDPDGVAYIMFTSGSTGVPKGVPMTHVNYINFVDNAMALLPFENGDVFSDYHDFGFDLSVFYLFCAPLVGGAFAPGIEERDRLMPLRHIVENGVTVLSSVPSIVSRIRQAKPSGLVETPVRIAFLCGEPFRLDILAYCQDVLRIPNIYNFYGLTETGVENFHHHCQTDDVEVYAEAGYVPIGLPLPGNDVQVDENGELSIAGEQLMTGYLGGVGADRFFEDGGVRWFRSGDRVEVYKDKYFCKGRLDSQVKVSGYRIDLMDIEAHMRRVDGVDDAVCFVVSRGERDFIVGAYKAVGGIDEARLPTTLGESLPPYMVPRALVRIDEMPLNKSGKVDRPRIRDMYESLEQTA